MKNQLLQKVFSRQSLLFLFILLLPTQFGKHFFFPFSYLSGVRIDYLALKIFVTDILSVLLIFAFRKNIFRIVKTKFFILLMFFFLLNFFFSLSPPISFYSTVKLLQMISIAIVIMSSFQTYQNTIMKAFAISLLFQTVLVFAQFLSKHSVQGIWYFFGERYLHLGMPGITKASIQGTEFMRAYGTFSHPNSLAGFYLLLSLFVLTNTRITNIVFRYVFIVLSACIIFLSFSKATFLIFAGLLLWYYLPSKKICRLCFFAKILSLGTVIILVFSVKTDPLSFQKRTELMFDSLQIIKQYPLWGTGIGAYLYAQQQFPSRYPYFFLQPVHNIFLLFIAQAGIPIGIFILVFGIISVVKILKHTHMTIPFLAFLATGMIDHYSLTLQQNMLLAAVLSGILFNNTVPFKNGLTTTHSNRRNQIRKKNNTPLSERKRRTASS